MGGDRPTAPDVHGGRRARRTVLEVRRHKTKTVNACEKHSIHNNIAKPAITGSAKIAEHIAGLGVFDVLLAALTQEVLSSGYKQAAGRIDRGISAKSPEADTPQVPDSNYYRTPPGNARKQDTIVYDAFDPVTGRIVRIAL